MTEQGITKHHCAFQDMRIRRKENSKHLPVIDYDIKVLFRHSLVAWERSQEHLQRLWCRKVFFFSVSFVVKASLEKVCPQHNARLPLRWAFYRWEVFPLVTFVTSALGSRLSSAYNGVEHLPAASVVLNLHCLYRLHLLFFFWFRFDLNRYQSWSKWYHVKAFCVVMSPQNSVRATGKVE